MSDRQSGTEEYDIASPSWNATWLFDAVFSLWEPGVPKMDLNNNLTHPTYAPTGKSRGEAIGPCETSPLKSIAATGTKHHKHLRNSPVTRIDTKGILSKNNLLKCFVFNR